MIEGISAATLGIHEMPRAARFYRALGFEVLHGGEESSFTSFIWPTIQDRDGGVLVMATLFGMFPFLKTLFADSGYQGPKVAKALAKSLPHLDIEIAKRSDQVRGFVVLPKRWIVERTIAWLNRCRRLAKD
jgi:hypothetical protein